ncbi:MAG: NAD(P)H-dependent oxidoreductase [Planctomycetota bacterium]|nr:NAD(P)H-dependent oxidoreductase [Planctomycetota bacterium]
MFLVISTSLSPKSRSKLLAKHVADLISEQGMEVDYIDLAQTQLPRCDASSCYANPVAQEVTAKVSNASGIVLATPVYNYSICSEAKNLVELTGKAWEDTVAGFLCAAGGQGSYMSVMHLANSLMLDFRTLIVPRFVYATGAAFAENQINDSDLLERLSLFANDFQRVTIALSQPSS